MQTVEQTPQPVVQQPQAPKGQNRNPTQPNPPARHNPDLQARHKIAAEHLRAQRGVDAPENKKPDAPAKPVENEKAGAAPSTPTPPPAKPQPPHPDAVAYAKAMREEAQRLRDEAAAERKATQERLNALKDDPIGFLAELGMSEEDWKKFNAQGGVAPQVSKELRELREAREANEKRLQEMEMRARRAEEDRDISASIANFPLVRKMGGADAARAHLQALKSRGETPGTWQDVLTSLESEYKEGLSRIFADDEINGKYGFKPQHQAPATTTPTTLGPNHTSSMSLDVTAKNPYPVGTPQNQEWKRKRMLAFTKGAIK